MLRSGERSARPSPSFAYRVRTPEDLDRAVEFYHPELGCRVERRAEGATTKGVGDSVRGGGPARLPVPVLLREVEHVERLAWRYDLYTPGALVRLDHFNQVTPDVPLAP